MQPHLCLAASMPLQVDLDSSKQDSVSALVRGVSPQQVASAHRASKLGSASSSKEVSASSSNQVVGLVNNSKGVSVSKVPTQESFHTTYSRPPVPRTQSRCSTIT